MLLNINILLNGPVNFTAKRCLSFVTKSYLLHVIYDRIWQPKNLQSLIRHFSDNVD